MNHKDMSFQKQYDHQFYNKCGPLLPKKISLWETHTQANNEFNPRGFDPPQLQQQLTIGPFLHAGEIHNGVDLNSA